MNVPYVRKLIEAYKSQFSRIHKEEIYKWTAIKWFKDHWDINAADFHSMLEMALSKTFNLLDSQTYYPKRMIENYSKASPELVRDMFAELYDEEQDLIARMEHFKSQAIAINDDLYPGRNPYQDKRALLVYLSMKYPERYYLYKFRMFKSFAESIDYPYIPKAGRVENVTQYLSMCSLVTAELKKDDELLRMHFERLDNDKYYQDDALHVLTQDFIYATGRHLRKIVDKEVQNKAEIEVVAGSYSSEKVFISLRGSFTNYIDNAKENKRIGDLGELFVLEFEKNKLILEKINFTPIHKSKDAGDGLGYDILSKSLNKKDKFIEVKTTRGPLTQTFYITASELHKSQQEPENYYLYRVYEFDETKKTGKVFIINGDLSEYCNNPVQYKVVLKSEKK